MDQYLSQQEAVSLTSEVTYQDRKAGIIGGYCQDGFPFYYADDAMASLLGYGSVEELEQAIDGRVINTIHPDDRAQVERDLGTDFREGMTYETTYRMPRKDGSWFWTVDRGKVIRTDDGRLAILSVCSDMSSFVQRQKELEARNAASDYLFKSMPGGYHRCAMDQGFPFLYVSERFLNILGWTEEELAARFDNKFLNLLHPDDRHLTPEYVDRIVSGRTESPYQTEIYRLQGRDGYRWVSDTTMKATVEGQSFFQGFITDITDFIAEREQRERELCRALEASEQRYEIISALSSVYKEMCVIDLGQGTYTIITGPAKAHAYEGKTGPLSELYHFFLAYNTAPEQASEVAAFLDFSTLADRMAQKKDITKEIRGKTGAWYRIAFIVKNRDDEGAVTHVLLTARDITEEKHRELTYQEDLRAAVIEARRAGEAKSTFLRRMSHDIRTPINGIIGMIEMADRHTGDREKLREYRQKTVSALEYLLALINNILDMGKVESGTIELETVPFDLTEVFDKSLPVMEMQANELGVQLMSQVDITHTKLLGSPVYLNRILANLTNNAIKYNRVGGSVTLSCREEPLDEARGMFVFRCADTGVGMSEAFQQRMFEPFAQEGKESITTYVGSGLGLSIVKTITEQMGGTITVESKENVGSAFVVSIPFAFDQSRQDADEDGGGEESSLLAGRRALLVEDNELNREIAEMLLTDQGLTVTSVCNGREAVDAFAASAPFAYDLIFMDIMMPVMNGLEATRAIRSLDRADAGTVPIIAMSANAFQDDIQSSLAAGMDAHLTKPVEAKRLRQTVRSVMAHRGKA